jgi:hypothetical protein
MALVSFPLAVANAVQVPLNVVVDWAGRAARFSRTNDALMLRDLISKMGHYGIGMSYWGDAIRQLAVGYGIAYPERVDLPALNRVFGQPILPRGSSKAMVTVPKRAF